MTIQETGQGAAGTALRRGVGAAGAVAIAIAVALPWVTLEGRLPLGLTVLGAEVAAGLRTVHGFDTDAAPALFAVAAIAAVLSILNRARRVRLGLGVLVLAASGGLIYYLANVVQFQTSDRTVLERTAADLVLGSSLGAGPFVLAAGGAALVASSLKRGSR